MHRRVKAAPKDASGQQTAAPPPFSRSMTLFVRMRVPRSEGKSALVSASSMPSSIFFAASINFITRSSSTTAFAFLRAALNSLECGSPWAICPPAFFGFGRDRENIPAKTDYTALEFGIWKPASHRLKHTHPLVTDEEGGERIFAGYNTSIGRIWIITEADRSVTTILFPSEY